MTLSALTLAAMMLMSTQGTIPPASIQHAGDGLVWGPAPANMPAGTRMAVLDGNPTQEGLFTIRLKVPSGSMLAPHWHPAEERVTVLSGAVQLGFGTVADPGKTQFLDAGSYYLNLRRAPHFLYFPEETVLQLTGFGPWQTYFVRDSTASTGRGGHMFVRSLTPPPDSRVALDDTLRAVIYYELDEFVPETYIVVFHFETVTQGRIASIIRRRIGGQRAQTQAQPPEWLTSARGTLTVDYDLEQLAGNRDLVRPLRLRISINRVTGPNRSEPVIVSQQFTFKE
jgi:hypothetical protein